MLDFKNTRMWIEAFTRSQRTASLAEINKSALTDHANQENHTINWSKATVIDREPDRLTRLIKEDIHIRKEDAQSTKAAVNSVTHATAFLTRQVQVLILLRTVRTSTSFFWWRSPIEIETSTKSKNWLCFDEFLIWNITICTHSMLTRDKKQTWWWKPKM